MNTEEFKRTGGIVATPRVMIATWTLQSNIPLEIQHIIVRASKAARKNPGGESCAQALLDNFNHYGEESLKNFLLTLFEAGEFKKWKGIKAAIDKKKLKKWFVSFRRHVEIESEVINRMAKEMADDIDREILESLRKVYGTGK